MPNAVSNSGPLIHLNEIGQIELLNMFGKLILPDTVIKETGKLNLGNVVVKQVSAKEIDDFTESIKESKLQKAEIDALYFSKKFNAIFLSDDLEARNAANKLSIEVHGSIGVIALAYKKGMINLDKAKHLLLRLYDNSSLFLTKSIVDVAIKELENQNN